MSTQTQSPSTDRSKARGDGADSQGEVQVISTTSRTDRLSSFKLDDFLMPTGREEEWRFSPVRNFQTMFAADFTGPRPTVAVRGDDAVTIEEVDQDDDRLGQAGVPSDRIAAAAWEHRGQSWVVTIPKNHVAKDAITIDIEGQCLGASVNHVVIQAEPLSEATVIINHTGVAEVAQTVEILVEQGANLKVVSLQDWAQDSIHVGAQRARLDRDGKLHHIVVTLNGKVVRLSPEAILYGPGAEVELDGVYFSDSGQHQEHRLFVDHAAPNCYSRVAYKGALQGEDARTVWIGDVLIRKDAEGTDTYELNRNLLLTPGARADSVPNLEIETGEIEGAGHASATGQFDDEQLFYLSSRGIPEAAARRLVVRGFFADLIQKIEVEEVEERILHEIEEELNAALGEVPDFGGLQAELDRSIEDGLAQ